MCGQSFAAVNLPTAQQSFSCGFSDVSVLCCLLKFGSSIVSLLSSFVYNLPTEDVNVASVNVNVRFCLEVTDGGSRMCQIQDMF